MGIWKISQGWGDLIRFSYESIDKNETIGCLAKGSKVGAKLNIEKIKFFES